MFKKVFFLFLLPLLGAVTFYACRCPDEPRVHLQPISLSAETHIGKDKGPVFSDIRLYVGVELDMNCIVQSKEHYNPFVSQAHALSMQCSCGHEGFYHDIVNFSVRTDSAYAGFPAGSDVSSLLVGYTTNYVSANEWDTTYYSFSEALQKMKEPKTDNGVGAARINMILTQKPGDNNYHSFTFTVTTEDTVFAASTNPFKWL